MEQAAFLLLIPLACINFKMKQMESKNKQTLLSSRNQYMKKELNNLK